MLIERKGRVFQQVQPQKYYMQIAKQIRDMILGGKLKIGDRLPAERTLAQQFGTSRASIREAMSALEMLGIIECRSGQGNFITADGSSGSIDGELLKALLKGHDPYEIFEARLELEPSVAALAAVRATAEDKTVLQKKLEELNGLSFKVHTGIRTLEDITEEYMECDRLFHLEVGKCSHNSVMYMVFSGVNLMMKEAHWRGMKRKSLLIEGNLQRYDIEHSAIFRAIYEGDQKAAREQMQNHIGILHEEVFAGKENVHQEE